VIKLVTKFAPENYILIVVVYVNFAKDNDYMFSKGSSIKQKIVD